MLPPLCFWLAEDIVFWSVVLTCPFFNTIGVVNCIAFQVLFSSSRPSTCNNSHLYIFHSTQFPFSLLSSTRSLIATFRPASLDIVSCNFFVYFCMFHPSPSIYQVHCPNMKLAKKIQIEEDLDFGHFDPSRNHRQQVNHGGCRPSFALPRREKRTAAPLCVKHF